MAPKMRFCGLSGYLWTWLRQHIVAQAMETTVDHLPMSTFQSLPLELRQQLRSLADGSLQVSSATVCGERTDAAQAQVLAYSTVAAEGNALLWTGPMLATQSPAQAAALVEMHFAIHQAATSLRWVLAPMD
jgi:hypothetical protein